MTDRDVERLAKWLHDAEGEEKDVPGYPFLKENQWVQDRYRAMARALLTRPPQVLRWALERKVRR